MRKFLGKRPVGNYEKIRRQCVILKYVLRKIDYESRRLMKLA
jgi:hypothetical protein